MKTFVFYLAIVVAVLGWVVYDQRQQLADNRDLALVAIELASRQNEVLDVAIDTSDHMKIRLNRIEDQLQEARDQVDIERSRRILAACHDGDYSEAFEFTATLMFNNPEKITPGFTEQEAWLYCARNVYQLCRQGRGDICGIELQHCIEKFGGPISKVDRRLTRKQVNRWALQAQRNLIDTRSIECAGSGEDTKS